MNEQLMIEAVGRLQNENADLKRQIKELRDKVRQREQILVVVGLFAAALTVARAW